MIEELIKDNTAAVKALTEAVRGLTVALQAAGSSPVAPAPAQERVIPPGYGPASPAEACAAVAHADGLTAEVAVIDEPAAPAQAPALAAAEDAAQVTVPDNLEGMRTLCIKAGEAGLTADIVRFLRERNVGMLRDLPQTEWGALVSFLNSKGVK